jgi:sigma-B regulation protein RsbU (phosphoserine phosphatase)
MSLRKRIQILLAFLVGIPLLLLLFESYRAGRHTLLKQMKEGSLGIAQLQAAEMDLTFEPPRLIAEGVARALEIVPELKPDRIRELLRSTLRQSPDLYGAAVAFHPALTSLGRFAPYVYRRDGVETEHSLTDPSYDYARRDWYRLPMESASGRWSLPYFDEGGGNVLMITFSALVRREGRVVGVATVDLSLRALVERLRRLKPGGEGAVYLVSPEGRILAHPSLKTLEDRRADRTLSGLEELIKRRGVDTVEMEDPVSRRTSWIVETPLRSLSAARGGHDWSLIVSWPLGGRLAPLTGLGRRMLVLYLFLGGGALLFLNRSFDQIITRPLRRLAEQARHYAEGDFSRPAPKHEEALELRELGRALNSLGAKLEGNPLPDRKSVV